MTKLQKCLRFAFFAVNFSVSVLLFLAAILSIVTGAISDPYSFVSGLVMVIPTGIYSLAEWFAYYRNWGSLEPPLGALSLGVGAFLAFGLVMNLAESLRSNSPQSRSFVFWFTLTIGAIIAYLAASGWFRLRYAVSKRNTDAPSESHTTA